MSRNPSIRGRKAELTPDAPRPSRIRRDPPPPEKPRSLRAYGTGENEQWVVIIGVILFALAIFIISIGVSEYTK